MSEIRLEPVDATTRSLEFVDSFIVAEHGDQATTFAAILSRVGEVAGLWWHLSPGYPPSLVARDVATLSHLGNFGVVVIDGDGSDEAASIIHDLLIGEPVTRETSFGPLVDAVNRPAPPRTLRVVPGEKLEKLRGRLVA